MAEEQPAASFRESRAEEGERVLGLVAEPGLAEKIAGKITRDLPELLSDACRTQGSSSGKWRVEVSRQLLPLDDRGSIPLLGVGQRLQRERGWHAVVVLTELPRRVGTRPILADGVPDQGIGLVSLAAMGAFRIRHRTQAVIVHLVAAHLGGSRDQGGAGGGGGRLSHLTRSSDYDVVEEPEADAREATPEEVVDADVRLGGGGFHLAVPGRRGQGRLLAGMVRANRPWRLVPSLSPALAGAMAGAAFGIFYSNIWTLADSLSLGRLALINVLGLLAMIGWLVLDNGLWERARKTPRSRRLRLYNAATLATITCGVLVMAVLLYAAMFVAACTVIPFDYLSSTLGHASSVTDLAVIAWLASCLGTFSGALGSGLAGEEAVRRAAYSERARQRQNLRASEEHRAERATTYEEHSDRPDPSAPL